MHVDLSSIRNDGTRPFSKSPTAHAQKTHCACVRIPTTHVQRYPQRYPLTARGQTFWATLCACATLPTALPTALPTDGTRPFSKSPTAHAQKTHCACVRIPTTHVQRYPQRYPLTARGQTFWATLCACATLPTALPTALPTDGTRPFSKSPTAHAQKTHCACVRIPTTHLQRYPQRYPLTARGQTFWATLCACATLPTALPTALPTDGTRPF